MPAFTIDQFEFTDDKPLFRITVQDSSAEKREVLPKDMRRVSESDGALAFSGKGLRVSVTLRQDAAEVLGSIRVESDGVMVREVRFPHIVWDSVEAFDSLLMSTAWGDNIPRPTKAIGDARGGEISYYYPSELAMQYMTLHNPGRSVYLSRYGTGDETFKLEAKVLGNRALAMSVLHYPFVESGAWESPECGFAVLPGGWHAAADLYGSHMRGKFTPPNVPRWMRESFHGWVQVGMAFVGGEVRHRFSDLPGIYTRIAELGLNTMHIFGWCGYGHDSEYPNYDPNPALGTEDDLRQAMDEIRSMGGHAILYTNGRLIDPASTFHKSGKSELCLKEDQQPWTENYGTGIEFRIACPTSEAYHEQLTGEIEKIARRYHAHAVQIDQISCNAGFPCFDSSHPHPTPYTNFLPGVEAMLRRIRQMHSEFDPEFFVWCEGCHERFGRFYDVNQGHGEEFTWQIGESTPEQFSYNYPDYIVTGISDTIQKLCYTFAQGKPFDFHLRALDDPQFAALVKQLVAVRKAHPEFFLRGTFRDCVGVEASAGTRVFLIKGPNDGVVVNVWVPGLALNGKASASIRMKQDEGAAKPVYPGDLHIRGNGDWLDLTWTGPVASLVMPG